MLHCQTRLRHGRCKLAVSSGDVDIRGVRQEGIAFVQPGTEV